MKTIEIYIKGNCVPNPGQGNHGFVCTLNDVGIPDCRFVFPTEETNNVREDMLALIHAIEWSLNFQAEYKIKIYTCNGFVENGFNGYLPSWEENGFLTASGDPVKNIPLWEKVAEMKKKFTGTVQWKKKEKNTWFIILEKYLKKNL